MTDLLSPRVKTTVRILTAVAAFCSLIAIALLCASLISSRWQAIFGLFYPISIHVLVTLLFLVVLWCVQVFLPHRGTFIQRLYSFAGLLYAPAIAWIICSVHPLPQTLAGITQALSGETPPPAVNLVVLLLYMTAQLGTFCVMLLILWCYYSFNPLLRPRLPSLMTPCCVAGIASQVLPLLDDSSLSASFTIASQCFFLATLSHLLLQLAKVIPSVASLPEPASGDTPQEEPTTNPFV